MLIENSGFLAKRQNFSKRLRKPLTLKKSESEKNSDQT